ncbi:DUF6668 family protein [Lysinibacter sp. HNR]|uniref:DUF6668 family protein n=1 Tax=Lysinibacter sp. HNR TaxID=3031408 RepID=UPI002435D848|nr:DUF6668 family protein [Lysinibacter sp. HNR]WGD37579.1 hypothetical protein FrondiHNR_01245 [Lysinibacter sp. HNR]
MSINNPFVIPPPEPVAIETLEDDPILGGALSINGVLDPSTLGHIETPSVNVPTPPHRVSLHGTVWLVGTSGGAGVSTLAQLTDPLIVDSMLSTPLRGGRIIYVAATHGLGLARAKTLGIALAQSRTHYQPVAIVFVHDRPDLSKATVRLASGIGRMFPRSFSIPYEPSWREPDSDLTVRSVRLTRTITAINKIAQKR